MNNIADIVSGNWTVRGALLSLHESSLQQLVHTEVPYDVVLPSSHNDTVSFTCRLHDVFIVHILLIDSISLTSADQTHTHITGVQSINQSINF